MHIGTTAVSPGGALEASVLIGVAPQPLYRHRVSGELFTPSVHGRAYTLRVRNLLDCRIEVLSTVDGISTLRPEPGDLGQNRGLVFAGLATGEFKGFRLDNGRVAEFVFGTPERSAARQVTGSAAHAGVIGFAAYREQWSWVYGSNPILRGVPAAAAVAAAGPVRGSAATEMGEVLDDPVSETTFRRSGDPDVLVIGYDTAGVLEAMGVIAPAGPQAFPGAGTGYEQYRQARQARP